MSCVAAAGPARRPPPAQDDGTVGDKERVKERGEERRDIYEERKIQIECGCECKWACVSERDGERQKEEAPPQTHRIHQRLGKNSPFHLAESKASFRREKNASPA